MVYVMVRFILLACLSISLMACQSARLHHFAEFSQSGVALADSVAPVLDEALRQAVKTNSTILIMNRGTASKKILENTILRDNKSFRERVKTFNDVKRHARLLRAYFVAIGNLAETSGDSATGSAAKGLVDAMGRISPKIASAKIGGLTVSSLVESVAPMAVGVFRSGALRRELRARGDAVLHEIQLQEAFLEAVAESMRSELHADAALTEFQEIVEPYLSNNPLPTNWAERRLASFQANISLDVVDAAAQATENLRLSFIALAEGRLTQTGVNLLLRDTERVVTLIKAIRHKPGS